MVRCREGTVYTDWSISSTGEWGVREHTRVCTLSSPLPLRGAAAAAAAATTTQRNPGCWGNERMGGGGGGGGGIDGGPCPKLGGGRAIGMDGVTAPREGGSVRNGLLAANSRSV